jgi:uncharacterized repeat protein (TIGR03803 family)
MHSSNVRIAKLGILLLGITLLLVAGASAASKEKVIYSFQGGSDGSNPWSDLVADAAGNLYGTTTAGGTGCNCGTVFELMRTKDGWKEQVLYSFTEGSDGGEPQTGLILDDAGNLYGTTWSAVFQLAPNGHGGWTESNLYTIPFGIWPAGDLAFDAKGNLYGASADDGNYGNHCGGKSDTGCGFVFQLSPQAGGSWTETTIYTFSGAPDAASPSSGLALDAAGNLYGVSSGGGTGSCLIRYQNATSGCGTVYELSPNSGGNWTESVLYSFTRGGGHGVYPLGGLLFDKASDVYGVSRAGGDGLGTVFKLHNSKKSGWQQTDLHLFYGKPNDGSTPIGRLATDAERNLFGVTSSGGANRAGTVFEMRHLKNRWKEIVLHSFGASGDGAEPLAGLAFGQNGHLYGTTQNGGTGTACRGGCGVVYEVTP